VSAPSFSWPLIAFGSQVELALVGVSSASKGGVIYQPIVEGRRK
jgi:hypothetical protein